MFVKMSDNKRLSTSEENTFSDYNALQSHLEETQYKKNGLVWTVILKLRKLKNTLKI